MKTDMNMVEQFHEIKNHVKTSFDSLDVTRISVVWKFPKGSFTKEIVENILDKGLLCDAYGVRSCFDAEWMIVEFRRGVAGVCWAHVESDLFFYTVTNYHDVQYFTPNLVFNYMSVGGDLLRMM